MAQRLTDRFAPGAQVEIWLPDEAWHAGRVLGHQPPGVWVQLPNGSLWFVTNTRRIRPRSDHDPRYD